MLIDNNLRCKYNIVGINNFKSTKSKHIKLNDINDYSTQYYNSIKIVNTYDKTLYVRYNNSIIKLKSLKSQLRHDKKRYVISSDYKYITIFDNNNNYSTYKIIETSKVIIDNNKLDRKLQKKIYN